MSVLLWLLLQDVGALEDQVRELHSKDSYDAAVQAVRKFAEAHPDAANDDRLKRLREKTQDLAREADLKFTQLMAEAQAHLDGGRPNQAMQSSAKAVGFYPERRLRVEEFQRNVQVRTASTAMVKVAAEPCWIGEPLRRIELPSFWIDRFPVTNEEYAVFAAATGAPAPQFSKGRERNPVVMVTWADAARYAEWAGKRLPTAEEWEVAARGSDRREFPWGKVFQEKEEKFPVNCLEYWQVNKSQSPGTTSVDFFSHQGYVSACGAAMGGNVWEWTSTTSPGKVGDRPVEFRVQKGGSFMTPSRSLRCAVELPDNPTLAHPDVGFRCAK